MKIIINVQKGLPAISCRFRRLQAGFTLIEMLMYMGLMSILLVVMVDLFATSLDLQLESRATSSVDKDGRFLVTRLTYDINRAQNIVTPTLGVQSSTLQLTIGGVSYTYTVNGGNLQLIDSNGTENLNSFDSTISNLSFQTIGNINGKHTVQAIFTVTSKTTRVSGAETKNFQTAVGLR